MKVIANEDTCVGSGQCEATLPSVFAVGDEGTVEVDQGAVAAADPQLLTRAVRACPTESLKLVED
jgi:ferredoxin